MLRRPFSSIFSVTMILFIICLTSTEAEWGEPVNLGPTINTAAFDYYRCISYDNTKLYFSSDRLGGYGEDDIYVSEWNGEGWDPPVNLGPNINTRQRELSPSISADGKKLYFVAYGRPGGYGWYDIWVSTWQDSMWGPAENVGPNVNTEDIEWSVCISSDGTELYFASDGFEIYGFFEICVSNWDGHRWGPAKVLGQNVNSGSDDEDPSISADGNSLYFASWDTDFIEQEADIFVSHRDSTGQWGPKERLSINCVADSVDPAGITGWDLGPSISSDGRHLYFSSRRKGNISYPADDIWVSEWTETSVVDEGENTVLPTKSFLSQSYPNPFNPVASIRYSVISDQSPPHVTLKIYNGLGREVKTLVDRYQETGFYEVTWDGTDNEGKGISSGVYFYRLIVENLEDTKKMVLIR